MLATRRNPRACHIHCPTTKFLSRFTLPSSSFIFSMLHLLTRVIYLPILALLNFLTLCICIFSLLISLYPTISNGLCVYYWFVNLFLMCGVEARVLYSIIPWSAQMQKDERGWVSFMRTTRSKHEIHYIADLEKVISSGGPRNFYSRLEQNFP